MKPDLDERTDPPAFAALTALARQGVQPATPLQLRRGWASVSARLAARTTRQRRLARLSMVGAATAALALAIIGVVSWSRSRMDRTAPAPLAYQIQGGSVVDGGYLRESGNGAVKLVFAEGTEFALMPGARGRLRGVDSVGARIAIEHGTASFQVTPRSDARWLVDVGPFLVTVKGTAFTVSWDAAMERFDLRLQHGQVSISGPISGGAIPLRAGQRLVINLPKGEILITEQKSEDAWPGSPPAGSTSRPTNFAADKTNGRHGWSEAMTAGRWDEILVDVDHAGLKRTLAEASGEDLFILADAARYRRRTGLAREALLAERRRFPGSPRALDASFLLGCLEESDGRGTSKAMAWYEEYLNRAPTGTYASEALGRKMIATSKLEGTTRAQPIAEEYLRRFPSGTYVGAARALLRNP